jgi:hypothetical protein
MQVPGLTSAEEIQNLRELIQRTNKDPIKTGNPRRIAHNMN